MAIGLDTKTPGKDANVVILRAKNDICEIDDGRLQYWRFYYDLGCIFNKPTRRGKRDRHSRNGKYSYKSIMRCRNAVDEFEKRDEIGERRVFTTRFMVV
ncbi:hypothetical protein U1Q18_048880, partial [Sarracenia purpurea var. burkii]